MAVTRRQSGLQRAAEATDPYFHKVLYDTLIDARAIKELLDLDGPHLEEHLRSHGGLPASPPNGPIGPLSASQVRCCTLARSSALAQAVTIHTVLYRAAAFVVCALCDGKELCPERVACICAICRSVNSYPAAGKSTAQLLHCCLSLKPVSGVLVAQVQHLELLAKLYIKRMAYENAARVYQVLASRRSGVADQAVSLAQRQEAYQNAVLQVPLLAGCLGGTLWPLIMGKRVLPPCKVCTMHCDDQ